MSNPSKDLVEVEGALRVVIENLIDAQEGLQKLGDEAKSELLKQFFLSESLKRAQFRGDLETILHQEGVKDIHETGTTAGTFVRAWTSLKAKLGGTEHALLEAAEEGEVSVLEAYDDAIKKDLPRPIRDVLADQVVEIGLSLEYVRAARESTK